MAALRYLCLLVALVVTAGAAEANTSVCFAESSCAESYSVSMGSNYFYYSPPLSSSSSCTVTITSSFSSGSMLTGGAIVVYGSSVDSSPDSGDITSTCTSGSNMFSCSMSMTVHTDGIDDVYLNVVSTRASVNMDLSISRSCGDSGSGTATLIGVLSFIFCCVLPCTGCAVALCKREQVLCFKKPKTTTLNNTSTGYPAQPNPAHQQGVAIPPPQQNAVPVPVPVATQMPPPQQQQQYPVAAPYPTQPSYPQQGAMYPPQPQQQPMYHPQHQQQLQPMYPVQPQQPMQYAGGYPAGAAPYSMGTEVPPPAMAPSAPPAQQQRQDGKVL